MAPSVPVVCLKTSLCLPLSVIEGDWPGEGSHGHDGLPEAAEESAGAGAGAEEAAGAAGEERAAGQQKGPGVQRDCSALRG